MVTPSEFRTQDNLQNQIKIGVRQPREALIGTNESRTHLQRFQERSNNNPSRQEQIVEKEAQTQVSVVNIKIKKLGVF